MHCTEWEMTNELLGWPDSPVSRLPNGKSDYVCPAMTGMLLPRAR